MPQLTRKQQLFVLEYLKDLNATQAAIRAGYSAKRADAIGYENLRKPEIAAAVQEAMNKRVAKLEITGEMVLAELGKLAFVNVQDLYDEEGILLPISKLPRHVAAAISAVKINLTEGCAVQEVKMWDKRGSLELLGKHLKLFTDKVEHSGEVGITPPSPDEAMRKVRERLEAENQTGGENGNSAGDSRQTA